MTGLMTVAPNQIWHAFAKVNLELEIRGRRPDGYHEIVTVLQTVDLSDRIRVFGAEEFRFSSNVDPTDRPSAGR
jgi:4-diphosphocytidyl-2-C-methyl-D-erythritol kinase